MENPIVTNKKALNKEINRVVLAEDVKYNNKIQKYVSDPASKAPYLIAETYDVRLALINHRSDLKRVPDAMDENNKKAGYKIYTSNNKLYIKKF